MQDLALQPLHMEMLLFRVSLVQKIFPSFSGRAALQKSGAGLKRWSIYSVIALYPISSPVHFSTVQMSLVSIQELLLQVP